MLLRTTIVTAALLISLPHAQAGGLLRAHTDVVVFRASSMRVERSVRGSCWVNSIASRRADAYRCMAGDSISDPCFTISSKSVACPGALAPARGIRIELTEPLPPPLSGAGRSVWAMRLAGGIACNMGTGTVIAGYPFYCTGNWVCASPPPGKKPAIFVRCGQPKSATEVTAVGRYLVTTMYE